MEQVVACPKLRDPVPTPESSAGSGRVVETASIRFVLGTSSHFLFGECIGMLACPIFCTS